MVSNVFVENVTPFTLHFTYKHASELPHTPTVTTGQKGFSYVPSNSNTTGTSSEPSSSTPYKPAPTNVKQDKAEDVKKSNASYPQPSWNILTTAISPGARVKVLDVAREHYILPDMSYFWDIDVTIPYLQVKLSKSQLPSSKNNSMSQLPLSLPSPRQGHPSQTSDTSDANTGNQDQYYMYTPGRRRGSLLVTEEKSTTQNDPSSSLKESSEYLRMKLMVRGTGVRSRLSYGLTSIPYENCSPQLTWFTDRKLHVSVWSAYGRHFQITYRTLFALGDDDVEFVIREISRDKLLDGEGSLESLNESIASLSMLKPERISIQEFVWENQRGSLRQTFSNQSLLPTDPLPWCDDNGKYKPDYKHLELPDPTWEWATEWSPAVTKDTDIHGWMYAFNWGTSWSSTCSSGMYVRRRKWVRLRRKQSSSATTSMNKLLEPNSSPTKETANLPASAVIEKLMRRLRKGRVDREKFKLLEQFTEKVLQQQEQRVKDNQEAAVRIEEPETLRVPSIKEVIPLFHHDYYRVQLIKLYMDKLNLFREVNDETQLIEHFNELEIHFWSYQKSLLSFHKKQTC